MDKPKPAAQRAAGLGLFFQFAVRTALLFSGEVK